MSFFILVSVEKAKEADDWDLYNKLRDYQDLMYKKVTREVFEIVYYGHYNSETVLEMSPYEREETIDYINEYRKQDDENANNLLKVLGLRQG